MKKTIILITMLLFMGGLTSISQIQRGKTNTTKTTKTTKSATTSPKTTTSKKTTTTKRTTPKTDKQNNTRSNVQTTTDNKPVSNSQSTRQTKKTVEDKTFIANGVPFKMIAVEGGTFTMGATNEQRSMADDRERPTHQVSLSSYYIGEYEVTQELWSAVMGNNPSYFRGNSIGNSLLPIENISWVECNVFIHKLNYITGEQFRMPTEAEWEYAARGGKRSKGTMYSGSNMPGDVAWYYDNSARKTHPVGCLKPNELGIYDMSGNVYEWCEDWYGDYKNGSQTNPAGPSEGSGHVVRGGSWDLKDDHCRVSKRLNFPSDIKSGGIGLRLAL